MTTYLSIVHSSEPSGRVATRTLAYDGLHRGLARFNQKRLRPGVPSDAWRDEIEAELQWRVLEGEFIESERRAVAHEASLAPTDADGFVAWFEALKSTGPGQGDPLFPWLAERADLVDLHWFLSQEVAGEAGFEDLVAMTQVKFEGSAKLELANNYWDEMGRGKAGGMHGPMLAKLSEEFGLSPRIDDVVWESLALGNLLVALAANRRYAYHSVGALGAVELTAPGRAELVNASLKRLGASPAGRRYFALHATLDVKHSEQWNRDVLRPLVTADPQLARPLAEGALLRLRAGARCFDRYRRELWSAPSPRRP